MAKDTLRIPVGPALQQALGMAKDKQEGLDYYELLGLRRGAASDDEIDAALKERSRILRQWQNSPTSGPEVVKLLPILHRAAKLLRDPHRADAYRKELQLQEKGETAGGVERFRQLARVALVGNEINSQDKLQLQQAAAHYGLDNSQVRQIIEEVRQEYHASRGAAPAPAEAPGWEFRLAGQGEAPLMDMLAGLQASGNHLAIGPKKLLDEVMRFEIPLPRAQEIVKRTMAEWFQDMVRMVAGSGAINEAQTRLILPKAPDFGLTEQEAFNVISEYSLSAVASDELRRQFELAETAFSEEDIGGFLDDSSSVIRRRSWLERMTSSLSGGPMIGIVLAVVVVAAAVGGIKMFSGKGGSASPEPPEHQPVSTPAAPTATPVVAMQLPPEVPNPESMLLRFDPEKDGDPPAFEIRIAEVTCSGYAEYLKLGMDAPPPGWPEDGACPAGAQNLPVTEVSWKSAMNYCSWVAQQQKFAPGSVRLPSIAEFQRAARGRTIRGNGDPQAPDYWDVARFWGKTEAAPAMATAWDKILNGKGQMYDLIGNVAEWGSDSQADKRVVLGGAFSDKAHDFNAMQPRWLTADSKQNWLGFRYVHVLAN